MSIVLSFACGTCGDEVEQLLDVPQVTRGGCAVALPPGWWEHAGEVHCPKHTLQRAELVVDLEPDEVP